jgi:hypothetical protein
VESDSTRHDCITESYLILIKGYHIWKSERSGVGVGVGVGVGAEIGAEVGIGVGVGVRVT